MAKSKAFERLLAAALAYPESREDHPWDHTVVKVKDKIFAFVDDDGKGGFYGGFKLPQSQGAALMLPFVSPMGYGMAKSGWVNASFEKGEKVPVELLLEWMDESYRAVAPVKLVKALDAAKGGAGEAPAKAPAAKKPAVKKPAAKKPAVKKPAAKKPAVKKPAAKKSPAKKRSPRE